MERRRVVDDCYNAVAQRAIEGQDAQTSRIAFLFWHGEWRARVFRLELATGKKEPWLDILRAQPAGSRGIIGHFRITQHGASDAYT